MTPKILIAAAALTLTMGTAYAAIEASDCCKEGAECCEEGAECCDEAKGTEGAHEGH